MKNTKKNIIRNLIIVLVTIIFTGSFLLFELGIPLKTSVYADPIEPTQTYSEFLHNLTLRNAKSSQVSPSITVLNHGYMGGPGAWNMDDNFDANSLAERLRTSLNADVYIMGVYYEEIRDQQTEELIKTIDSRVYVQHPIGYIDEKYDAGNDRYTDGNGNGIKAQEIGLTNKN